MDGERDRRDERWKTGERVSFISGLARMTLRSPCSQKRNVVSTQEDPRGQFYEVYRKEAEEYDKEFMKKYDEDLNTTLIFVSFVSSFGGRVLTKPKGWSILRSHLRIHHRRPVPTPTRHG